MTTLVSWLRRTGMAAALALGGALMLSAAPAAAVPVLSSPLVASGPITAIYVYKSAADTSSLWLGTTQLFNNSVSPVGLVANVGGAGLAAFELKNETMGYSFFTGVADSVDGKYYAGFSSNFADFGVGALPTDAQTAIDAAGGGFLFIGFEDRRGGDFDFNDLIFAFKPVAVQQPVQQVPEPASLALLGIGLLGLALGQRRRRR